VTGATGFLGGEIALELQRSGYQVTALVRPGSDRSHLPGGDITFVEGDVTEPDIVARAMENQSYVCHAAALVPGTRASKSEFERVNVGGTRVVCEAAIEAGVSRLLHISTAHVFGIDAGTSVDEESRPLTPPHAGYDASKAMAETIVMDYAAGSLDAVIVNPAVVFGPRSRHSGRLISLFLRGKLPFTPLPNRVLSLVYSGDVASGARMALESGSRGERYILAAPGVTVREFITELATASGRRAPRISLPAWPVICGVALAWAASPISRWRPPITTTGIRHGGTIYDGRKAARKLGIRYTSLEAGLASTVEGMIGRN
jgi:dihydroflavonol-4-reductase